MKRKLLALTRCAGLALGLTACAIAVITDAPLALAFVEALGEDAALAPVRQVLTAQKVRIEKRRKEEQAHRENVRRGKKESGPTGAPPPETRRRMEPSG